MKRRRRGVACALGATLLTLLSSVHARADLAQIKKRGVLRTLVRPGRPELFTTEAGAPPGLEHEILLGFAKRHGVKLEAVAVASQAARLTDLLGSKGDVIGLTNTAFLGEPIAFSSEIIPTRFVVVTRKPHRVVKTLQELYKEKIGVVKGADNVDVLIGAGVPAAQIHDEFVAPAVALKEGKLTALVWAVDKAVLFQQKDPSYQLGMFVGPPAGRAFAVRREDKELLAALNQHIEILRSTDVWNRLLVKYFGTTAQDVLRMGRPAR